MGWHANKIHAEQKRLRKTSYVTQMHDSPAAGETERYNLSISLGGIFTGSLRL